MGMSTTSSEKVFLRQQIDAIQARRVLEIGSFKGETTRVLSDAVAKRHGVVVAIDPMKWGSEIVHNGIMRHLGPSFRPLLERVARWFPPVSYEPAFRREVDSAGHDNVHLFRRLSTDPQLLANEHPLLAEFDLVFIDGDHSYEGAKADLENWGRRVRPGGRVLVHDAIPRFQGVCDAIEAWAADRNVKVDPERHGSICAIEILGQPAEKTDPARPREAVASLAG
jgi:predicted O-methyltransferase YrrM